MIALQNVLLDSPHVPHVPHVPKAPGLPDLLTAYLPRTWLHR